MKSLFPIFKNNPTLVYLDTAATSLKPRQVISAQTDYDTKFSANIHRGFYQISQTASQLYDHSRQNIADFIGADFSEIIFTSGTTASINLIAHSWGELNISSGDEIIVSGMEHHSNFIPWQQLAIKKNAILKIIPVTVDFTLDLDSLSRLITSKTKLVALTHISNVLGTINPIKDIVHLVKKINPETKILIDAAQSIAHLPVNVVDLGIDFLAFSGHKMYGPTGVGVLWVKQDNYSHMSPSSFGGGAISQVSVDTTVFQDPPQCYEPGTPPISQIIALSQAVDFITSIGWSKIMSHESKLTQYALQKLSSFKHLKIIGPIDSRSGVIAFVFDHPGLPAPHDLGDILSHQFNLAIRTGFHCAMPLHSQFGLDTGTSRLSFGIYNTSSDIDTLIEGLKYSLKIFTQNG
ncbi:MAG TPA: cysteine desulfurase [Candidatus Woesebacteria bacterium]|nr:cysteine desulfurase [Candidatus Shapirobacteria bacterium]HOR01755.1 cysteine desulfurase [Candidatus Woesebacteria bacterium]